MMCCVLVNSNSYGFLEELMKFSALNVRVKKISHKMEVEGGGGGAGCCVKSYQKWIM